MDKNKLLTIDEMAEILCVKKSWIYQKSHRKAIPFVKVGRFLRFQPEEVIKHFAINETRSYLINS